ncbi:Membrane fusion protein (MFP) family protein [Gammaproteobacteria bacterium]
MNKFFLTRTRSTDIDFLPDADAIEQRPLGGVTRWTLYSLAWLIVALITWASIAEVDEIVVGYGKLATTQPNITVQPLETAIIQSINVRVGQLVKKNQKLASLDPTFVIADESQLRGRLASLDARVKRLESELTRHDGKFNKNRTEDEQLQDQIRAARQASYHSRLTQFNETLEKLKASLLTNQRDQQLLMARVKLLKEMEVMQERLVAKNISARQYYLEAQEKRLEIDRDLGVAQYREAEIRREISAEQAGREAFIKEWDQKTMEELAQIRDDRDSISEQLQKAQKRHTLVTLETPADAIVLDIAKRSIGSVIREAESLITLVPLDVPLEAEVQINAADIGFVKKGDIVRIKLNAFPFQKHGTLSGSVEVVSEDAFSRDLSQNIAGQSDVYYLVRVALGSIHLENVGRDFRLIPGLTLSAEIKIRKRSVISFFLYPLIRALDEGLRER